MIILVKDSKLLGFIFVKIEDSATRSNVGVCFQEREREREEEIDFYSEEDKKLDSLMSSGVFIQG